MASVLVPVLYVVLVFGGLWAFSSWYRKRNAAEIYESYFPQHRERDLYVSLLQKTDPPTPEPLLKAALVRRAMTDVTRILRLREDKPALQILLQKGSIGDDLWNSLLNAEKEMEAELLEVAAEANAYVEGWGQVIFQTASEMMANERMRALLERIPVMRTEKERKYGRVSSRRVIEPITPATPTTPASAVPAPVSAMPKSPATPAPPETPVSAVSSSSLAPPSASTENFASDSEGPGSPASPRSPSKSSKKSKKRK
ncbi:Pre protein translocase subunit Sec66-domain-containing protein [Fomitopsis serialis]|uniref:Pre protein translocase subunit Sec66-domain-containing protein n=1 Tax=Fomitopsis serialis TaxID=139415 RepID=UPI0020085953|nr:Pre protein translocase subunit Sec66-domain-containing protein [Neoantrodia serialis]KAH9926220.1 Pre protein translocase subunit Sec66-domain-containing protein [Neoantrodia serialis]